MNKKIFIPIFFYVFLFSSVSCWGVEAPRLTIENGESGISQGIRKEYLIDIFLVLVPLCMITGVWIYSLRCQVARKTVDLRWELIRSELAEKEVERLNGELIRSRREIAFTLGEVIESRSRETANHVRRVASLTEYLGVLAGIEVKKARQIGLASSMHDIGKIGIPDGILNKPGRLTSSEFEVVKTHTTIGYDILSRAGGKLFDSAALIALQHHEWWDGSGYPKGLKGKNISIEGRLVAIADVFDALLHPRIYKEAWAVLRVVKTMRSERGSHFDPDLLDLFLANLSGILQISDSMPDEVYDRKEIHPA